MPTAVNNYPDFDTLTPVDTKPSVPDWESLSPVTNSPDFESLTPVTQEDSSQSSYNTPLNSSQESQFQDWKKKYAPNDSGSDYDLRGAFKSGLTPSDNGHWPDTFKKPNHPTFSDESIYASQSPEKAGHWNGDTFIPPQQQSSVSANIPDINKLGVFQPSQFSSGSQNVAPLNSENPDYDFSRATLGKVVPAVTTGINKVMDLAGRGVLSVANLPTTIANKVRGATPDSPDYVQPLDKASPNPFQIPELTSDDAKTLGFSPIVKGIHNALSETWNGLTEPQMALAMPALGLGSLSKYATTAFATQLAANIPESIGNIADANTQEEKSKAWANAAIQGLMLAGSVKHAGADVAKPEPSAPSESPEVNQLVQSASKVLPDAAKAVADISPQTKTGDTKNAIPIQKGDALHVQPAPTDSGELGQGVRQTTAQPAGEGAAQETSTAQEKVAPPEVLLDKSLVAQVKNRIRELNLPPEELKANALRLRQEANDSFQAEPDKSNPSNKTKNISAIGTQYAELYREATGSHIDAAPEIDKGLENPTPALNPEPPLSEASGKTETPASEPVVAQTAPNQGEIQQKYRVGSNPTLHSLVEKLPASQIEIDNGEQPVRIRNDKTGEVQTVMQSDLTPVKERTAAEKVKKPTISDKLGKLGYSIEQIASMGKEGAKALAERGGELPKARLSQGGPGAGEAGEPGTYSAIQSLADQIQISVHPDASIESRISLIDRLKSGTTDAKDSLRNTGAKAVAVKDALWNRYKGLPEYGDEKAAVGRWTYALQRADFEARQFAKQIIKRVPDKIRREAITNYIQANGDTMLLKERALASKGSLRQGYEAAAHLKPSEIEIAKLLREYYDKQLANGQAQDLVGEGLDNYITQVWKKENPITRALRLDLSPSKLKTNFDYAKKRFYDSFFEGEQVGLKPEKDAGLLVAMYDQSFNKTLAARAFLKDLHEGKASDGRPLVEVSGSGKIIEPDASGKQKVIITPKIKPEDASDYRVIDHPAMRGWKWVAQVDGKPVLIQGDLLVHPEAYQKLRNRLSTSAFRNYPVGRAVLGAQSVVKQTMLSLSGFHQVQEGLHALGHRINPTNLEQIDFSDPVTKSLVTHGLQLADYHALDQFSEGVGSGGLINKIPVLGSKILKPYTEYLFQDYIPRLKLTMAKHALERNIDRYQGKISNDQIIEMTANQANAAFGELNYKYIGRNPTTQDALRTFLLAPDFLEARAKFVGQAAAPYGKEQLQALGLLAATMYITARLANTAISGDPQWDAKHAFSIVVGNHAYTLRTIPGDLLHLFSDPQSFVSHRLSPLMRTGFEYVSGRDDRGVKRDIGQQVKDLATSSIPLSLRKRDDQSLWEAFLNSFGVGTTRYDTVQNIQQKVSEFKKANGIKNAYEETYDPDSDKYRPLRVAIESGNETAAKKALEELKKMMNIGKIREHFYLSYNHPFTGSRANDIKFQKGLKPAELQELKEAQDLRKQRLQFFQKIVK